MNDLSAQQAIELVDAEVKGVEKCIPVGLFTIDQRALLLSLIVAGISGGIRLAALHGASGEMKALPLSLACVEISKKGRPS